jgi:hypothetical protein
MEAKGGDLTDLAVEGHPLRTGPGTAERVYGEFAARPSRRSPRRPEPGHATQQHAKPAG